MTETVPKCRRVLRTVGVYPTLESAKSLAFSDVFPNTFARFSTTPANLAMMATEDDCYTKHNRAMDKWRHKMSTSHSGQAEITHEDVQLLTLPQVAERLQVSLSDVRRKIRAGVLPSIRLGSRQVRVLVSDLQAYVESRRRSLYRDGEASQ